MTAWISTIRRGEVMGIVGGSGTGKSVLMRTIVGLNRPAAGEVEVLGRDVWHASDEEWRELEIALGRAFSGRRFVLARLPSRRTSRCR